QLLLVALPAIAVTHCGLRQEQLNQADELVRTGRFTEALIAYKRLDQKWPDNIAVQSGLGRLYSLEPLTVFQGLDYLRQSFERQPDPAVWQDIEDLLLAMRRYAQALAYMQEPYISLEQMFQPQMIVRRRGLECLNSPAYQSYRELLEQADSAPGKFFLLLCSHQYQGSALIDNQRYIVLQQELRQGSDPLYCQYVNLFSAMPAEQRQAAAFPYWSNWNVQIELQRCRSAYPGSYAIQRRIAAFLPSAAPGHDSTPGVLFHSDPFHVEDPGRPDVPPWPDHSRLRPVIEPGVNH
ncbi:MAG: hypothetical protein KDK39_01065, partial [Leptospiraceae bacterium]|nr:hypothetical protein [Leptospiraceae bacterium]